MKKIILTALFVVSIAAAVYFLGLGYRVAAPSQYSTVTTTEELSDGRVDISLRQMGDLTVMIEVKLAPEQEAVDLLQIKPEATLAMEEMHMDGIFPMFSLVSFGFWQGKVILPMAGSWVVSVGFGEEFIETTIVVQ